MIVELLRVQCGCGHTLAGLFDNHHQAIVAGERAGWLMQSESIGGDQCPRCLGREGNTVDDWKAYDESVAGQWHAYNEAIARGVELWEYAASLRDDFDCIVDALDTSDAIFNEVVSQCDDAEVALDNAREQIERLIEQRDEARAEVERLTSNEYGLVVMLERDEARAEVEVWRQYVADADTRFASAMTLVEGLRAERDEARAELENERRSQRIRNEVERLRAKDGSRDEARAEVERLKAELEAARKECLRVARESWDTNDNGAIDDADELAAYAEASDLRALAERESE